jgi:nucleotide-binding universal stress UspA family protein
MESGQSPAKSRIRKVLVAVDGSQHSHKAFDRALGIAKSAGTKLVILYAIPDTLTGGFVEYGTKHGGMAIVNAYHTAAERQALRWMRPLETKAKNVGLDAKMEIIWELGKSPVQLITRYADANSIDLIVMGSRGIGGLKRLLLGSVADGVIRHANCSVMVVR